MRLSGSVKLRCALPSGSVFVGVLPLFLPPSATRRSSASARALARHLGCGLGFGLQRGLGLLRIGSLGGLEPAIDLRFKLRFPLAGQSFGWLATFVGACWQ